MARVGHRMAGCAESAVAAPYVVGGRPPVPVPRAGSGGPRVVAVAELDDVEVLQGIWVHIPAQVVAATGTGTCFIVGGVVGG